MISKKLISLFAVTAIAGTLLAGSALAVNEQAYSSGMGMKLGLNKTNGNNGDQVNRLQAMIEQLQKQLDQLRGKNDNSTTTVAVADLACVKTAVDTRETAISSAFSTLLTACQTTAFSARKTALDAAWDIAATKDRNAAINKAWQTYDKTEKDCRSAYRAADKAAWDAFKTATKACNVNNFEGMREGRDFNF